MLCIIIAGRIEFLSCCFGWSRISAVCHSYLLAIGLLSVSFMARVFNESGVVFPLVGSHGVLDSDKVFDGVSSSA